MSSLQEIKSAVEKATDYGYAAMQYKKGASSPAKGERFEVGVVALVFLRCLRDGLIFQLSANNGDAGKFDDLALVWRRRAESEAHMMIVQLKQKDSTSIQRNAWLSRSPKCDFGFNMYSASYKSISQLQKMDKVPCVLMTNCSPSKDSLSLFKSHEVASEPGLRLLQTQRVQGHSCYKINADDEEAWQAVDRNGAFVEHFYLLCKQSDCVRIERDICRELEGLLGAGVLCGSICDSLFKSVREWMDRRKRVCLTRGWSKWQEIVDEYARKEVTGLGVVTTRLKYRSVEDVRSYVKSCNPAWVRPPEGGTEVLSATRIHQALVGQTHIMADVKHFTQLRHRILHCWGPFCPWLVIVDDGTEESSVVLDELLELIKNGRHFVAESSTRNGTGQIKSLGGSYQSCDVSGDETETARRLVIVSARKNDKVGNEIFDDICQSSDVRDDSWEELLDTSVRLNGENYQCQLKDVVAGVNALKSLVDGRPALLLALAQLPQPLRMGKELETLPAHYVPMRLMDRRLVTADFLKTLGNGDVCFTNPLSFGPLQHVIASRPVTTNYTVMNVAKFQSWSRAPSEIEWPLIVLTDDLRAVWELFRNQRNFNVYVINYPHNHTPYGYCDHISWQIVYCFGDRNRCRQYRMKKKLQKNVLHTVENVVIVNGRPGLGKSMMLSHTATKIKKTYPSFWIIRVNLVKFYTAIKNMESVETAVETILKAALSNDDELGDLELELLQYSLSESRGVVCLVDGFDEVSAKSVDKCLEVLHRLAPRRGKLVVTTRPTEVKVLESQMGVFACSLVPFSDSELEAFLRNHPSSKGIKPVKYLKKSVRELLRIPLYADMYTKLSPEGIERYDTVSLYDAFFREKFKRLRETKYGQNLSIDELAAEAEEAQWRHEEELMLLAAYCLLGRGYEYEPADPSLFVKVGIVYNFVDGRPVFQHRTFAEHFFARWCCRRAGRAVRWAVFRRVWRVFREAYGKRKLEFFQESFDCMAAQGRPLLEAAMQVLVGGATLGTVRRLLEGGEDPAQVDPFGRSALHLAAAHDSPQAVSLVHLLRLHATREALYRHDDLVWWTPARYAAQQGRWAVVGALLLDGGSISHQLGDFPVGTHPPGELTAVFEEHGYRALFDHVVRRPSGDNLDDQVEFAVSLVCGNCVPLHLLKVIGEKAEENGHMEVRRLLLCEYDARIKELPFFIFGVLLLSLLVTYLGGWDTSVKISLLVGAPL